MRLSVIPCGEATAWRALVRSFWPMRSRGAISSAAPRPPMPLKLKPEDALQRSVVYSLRLALPKPCILYSVPNGGNLSRAQAAVFQLTGLLAGVHDLHLIWPQGLEGSSFPGGFGTMELKAGKNTLTKAQEDFADDMRANGHPWGEVRCLGDAWGLAAAWIFPLRLRGRLVP